MQGRRRWIVEVSSNLYICEQVSGAVLDGGCWQDLWLTFAEGRPTLLVCGMSGSKDRLVIGRSLLRRLAI